MISNDRLNHIISVARLMEKYCRDNNYSEDYAKEMFLLGYLHDIGYEFGEHSNHGEVGGVLLQKMNYKYFNEIKFHGDTKTTYKSKELDLLNWADMHTDGKGNYVSFEERLKDIANRRGETSAAYIDSKETISRLLQKGFK